MPLARRDLWSLEEYAERRADFRAEVLAHKRHRQLSLTPNARIIFEDALTIRYQIQEMLRIEKVFEAAGIQDELDAYNPLIPDGDNWKATFMLEFDDEAERRRQLASLVGIEDQLWLRVEGFEPVYAIADEDLPRDREGKTSSVHFLRFQLNAEQCRAVRGGAGLSAGCDHPQMPVAEKPLDEALVRSLRGDLAPE